MSHDAAEQPCAVLHAEHQVILRVIGVLDRLMNDFEQRSEFAAAPRHCRANGTLATLVISCYANANAEASPPRCFA